MRGFIKRFNISGIIIMMIVALGLFIQFSNFNKIQIKQTQMITSLSRDAIGSQISNQLMEKAQVISALSDYIATKNWSDEELEEYLRILTSNNASFSMIYLGKPSNVIINGSGWIPDKSFDLRVRPWYIKALAEDKLVFSEVFANAAKEELIVTIAKPVYTPRGEFLGVVAGDVAIDKILAIVQDKKVSENEYSFIIDGMGNILAHPFYEYSYSSEIRNIDEVSSEVNREMHQNMKGMTRITLDGVKGYLAYQPIENTDWRIGSFVSLNKYMESRHQYIWLFVTTFITSILVFIILFLLEKKYFLNPIVSLDRDIHEINIEHNIAYRLPVLKKEPFEGLRQSINVALDKTQEFFSRMEDDEEELKANNKELEASLQQLAATEEELWNHNEQLKKSQNSLMLSEEKYKSLITQMQQGIMLFEDIYDESGEIEDYLFIDINESFEKLSGFSRKDIVGRRLTEVVPSMAAYWIEKHSSVSKTGEPVHCEEYFETIDKYFEIIAYRPKLKQMAAIITDITERKMAEEAVKSSEETFRALFEGSSDAILIMKDSKFVYCNNAAIGMFGYTSKDSIIGKGICALSPEKQMDGMLSCEKQIEINKIAKAKDNYKFEWLLKKADGKLFPVEVMLTPIVLNGKEAFHVLWRDISERKHMEQRLEYLSYHDQLTGLYNRRFLVEELNRLDVKRNYPLTIVMADVNGLKLINDSFGHSKGDELLVKTAEVIRNGCRADDIISRIGGDEFVMLLPKTDVAEAQKIVKRIKSICLNEKVASLELSISFGWEAKLHEDEDIDQVFKKAEDYLYKRKLFESPSMRGKTISAIISTLHEKNKREEQHSHRVSTLCENMGKVLDLPEGDIQELKTVGLLHDIGKIAIDENILNKPGKLNEEEKEEIKKHPEIGYRILSSVNDMSEMAEYVLSHHERWDGGGYPRRLRGEEIAIQARILAIADAYDAMTSERPYRSALPMETAINELKRNAGTQFSPELVKVFIENVKRFQS